MTRVISQNLGKPRVLAGWVLVLFQENWGHSRIESRMDPIHFLS